MSIEERPNKKKTAPAVTTVDRRRPLADRNGALGGINNFLKEVSHLPVGKRHEELETMVLENDVTLIEAGMGTGKTLAGLLAAFNALLTKYEHTKGIATEPTKTLMESAAKPYREYIGDKYVHVYHEGIAPLASSRLEVTGYQSLANQFARFKVLLDKHPEEAPENPLADYNFIFIDEAHRLFDDHKFADLLPDIKEAMIARAGTDNPLRVILASGTMQSERMKDFFIKNAKLSVGHFKEEVRMHELHTNFLDKKDENEPINIPYETYNHILKFLQKGAHGKRHILSFIPGKTGIGLLEKWLNKYIKEKKLEDTLEVMTLFGGEEGKSNQERINAPTDKQRIYLATTVVQEGANFAGLGYVTACGRTFDSVYDASTGITLQEEVYLPRDAILQQISRAGREAEGTADILLTKEKFNSLPEHKESSTDLTGLVLRLKAKGVDIYNEDYYAKEQTTTFKANLGVAERTLQKLGALDRTMKLTDIGKQMAKTGEEDPAIARMIVQAQILEEGDTEETVKNRLNAIGIIKGLIQSKQSPLARGIPDEYKMDKTSDFINALNVWKKAYVIASKERDKATKKKLYQGLADNGINVEAFSSAETARKELLNAMLDDKQAPYLKVDLSEASRQRIKECILAGLFPLNMTYDDDGKKYVSNINPNRRIMTGKSSVFNDNNYHPPELVGGRFGKNREFGEIEEQMAQIIDEEALKKVAAGYYELLGRGKGAPETSTLPLQQVNAEPLGEIQAAQNELAQSTPDDEAHTIDLRQKQAAAEQEKARRPTEKDFPQKMDINPLNTIWNYWRKRSNRNRPLTKLEERESKKAS